MSGMPSKPTKTPPNQPPCCQYFGQKLFYMHFNDTGAVDDDMTVGSVHTIEMLELLYWLTCRLQRLVRLDIFPYRRNA